MPKEISFDVTGLTAPHAQATSTGTANVQTLTVPAGANAVLISVETTNARVTSDGTTPSATNGLVYQKDASPVFVPLAETIKFVSTAAANSVLNALWIS